MPELPEVEICKRQLAARLRGRTIRELAARDPWLRLPRALVGRVIRGVSRRGKYIVFELDNGTHILAHLGMTGWFEFREPHRYRLAIVTDQATAYFEDPRRFGKVRAVTARQLAEILDRLGPEPLEPGFDLNRLKRTSRPVKVALLDQRLVAGIGNIYASESLWRARIHPRRRADRLGSEQMRRLRRSIIAALRQAIAYGPRIYDVQEFRAYDRDKKPCRRCRTPIRRIVLGGRSTFFCPRCQR